MSVNVCVVDDKQLPTRRSQDLLFPPHPQIIRANAERNVTGKTRHGFAAHIACMLYRSFFLVDHTILSVGYEAASLSVATEQNQKT